MPDVLHAALGKRIREQRESSNLTQAELADRVKISRTSLTNMESGRQRVLVDQLYRLAGALAVGPEDLLPPLSELGKKRSKPSSNKAIPDSVHKFLERVRLDDNK
jgi:transcriptional regulator with XRE-family HTH domain